jgi:putative lipoprotein
VPRFLGALGMTVLLGACSAAVSGGAPSDALVITGELTFRQRIALPPSGEVVVMLQEVSRADAPADIVGSQHIALTGQQVPIPFRLTIPRSALNPTRRYVVRATIRDAEQRLLWTTDQVYAVDPTVRGVNFNAMNLVSGGFGR